MKKRIACICLVTVLCGAVLLGGCKPTSTPLHTSVDVPASAVSKTEFFRYGAGMHPAYLCGEWWIEQEQVGHKLTAHSLKTGEKRLLVDTYNNEGVFTFEVFGNCALFNNCFDALYVVDMTKENTHQTINSQLLAEDPYDACYIRQAFIHGDDVYIFHSNHFDDDYIVERVSLADSTSVIIVEAHGEERIDRIDMRGDALCVYGSKPGDKHLLEKNLREYDRAGKLLGEYPSEPDSKIHVAENFQSGAVPPDDITEILGTTVFSDWQDDRLWVMREHGVSAYTRTDDGYTLTFISPLPSSAVYAGMTDGYAFYWTGNDKVLTSVNLSTWCTTDFKLDFPKTVEQIQISNGGYVMLLTPSEDDSDRMYWYAVDLTAWF